MALLGQARIVYPQSAGTQPTAAEVLVLDTFNQTTDPTTANDSTQNYQVGSQWCNTSAGALRWWTCHDNAVGAAKWVFTGADYANGGTNPNTEQVQFGSGSALVAADGNINRQSSTTGINPAFIGADIVVAVYAIPANSLDVANRMITAQAWGGFSADATSKHVKMFFSPNIQTASTTISGGTVMADTLATTSNSGGWYVSGNIFNIGANTQLITSNGAIAGSAHSGMTAPSVTTGTTTSALYISVTCNNTAATTSSVFNLMTVDAMN
jgi:hypothetical protein